MAPNGRFKKQRRKKCHVLSQDEVKFLSDNTNFETKTIVDWHKVCPEFLDYKSLIFIAQGFMEDCPDGRMDRSKMQVMFQSVIPEVT